MTAVKPGITPVRWVHEEFKSVLLLVEQTQHMTELERVKVAAKVAATCLDLVSEKCHDPYLRRITHHVRKYGVKTRYEHEVGT